MKKTILILFVALFPLCCLAEEENRMSGDDCGEHCSWKIEDGVLTLTGYGDINSYTRTAPNEVCCQTDAPWHWDKANITKVVIENEPGTSGFSSVGVYAFSDMGHVQQVVLPEGLEEIKSSAFLACHALKDVNLPSSLTSIAGYAFDAVPLEHIEIPSGITKIEGCAFGNAKFKSIVIPENVTSIDRYAFTISTGESSTPLEKIYCPEHLIDQCTSALFFRTNAGLQTDVISYQKTADGQVFYNNQWYASANDITSGNHIKKRIYTIDEATKVSKETGNTFKLRYK